MGSTENTRTKTHTDTQVYGNEPPQPVLTAQQLPSMHRNGSL